MLEVVKISADFSIEGYYSAIKFDWNDKFVFSGKYNKGVTANA